MPDADQIVARAAPVIEHDFAVVAGHGEHLDVAGILVVAPVEIIERSLGGVEGAMIADVLNRPVMLIARRRRGQMPAGEKAHEAPGRSFHSPGETADGRHA